MKYIILNNQRKVKTIINYLIDKMSLPQIQRRLNIYDEDDSFQIEILNNKLEICYDAIKEYNKVSNGYFDDGLNNWGYEVYGQNSAYVKNEKGNNFLHLQLKCYYKLHRELFYFLL